MSKDNPKKIIVETAPPIIEVPDVESAINLWNSGLYRSPEYDKHKSSYIFIMKAKKRVKE